MGQGYGAVHRRGLDPAGVGGVLLVAAFVCVCVLLPPLVLEGVSVTVSFLAATVCAVASRRSVGRGRVAWACLGVLLALWGCADVLWALADYEVAAQAHAPADVVYLLGAVAALAGLLLLPAGGWERGSTSRVVLDVAVLALPVLIVGELLVLRRLHEQPLTTSVVYLVVWPVINVVLASLAFVVTRRRGDRIRPELALVTLAFVSWAVGDTWLASMTLSDEDYLGSFAQVLFLVGPLLLGLAALTVARRTHVADEPREGVQRHATCRIVVVLPDLVVVGAGLVCIAVGLQSTTQWVLVGLAAGLAMVRYAVVAFDAQHLRETLERRVEERTASARVVGDRLEAILGSVEEGIVGLRADGVVGFVNPAAARLLATTPDALLGRPACEALCGVVHAQCPPSLAAELGQRLEGVETSLSTGDGRLLPVELGATPVCREFGDDSLRCVVTFRDVTERRAVQQAKHQFVSTVSHELRTPLTAIGGALEMLADGDGGELSDDATALVASAGRGVDRLGRLVEDILDAEAMAGGRFSVVARPVEVAEVVCGAVEALAAWADGHGVRLAVTRLEGVVLADPDRLEQALTNLTGNAVKFSSPGGTVRLSALVRERDVLVEVRDEGRGIPAADLPYVFDRFHQVLEVDSTEKGGAGLGLTITRSIVERHGGRIWVASEVGRGTTVSFTLPRHLR